MARRWCGCCGGGNRTRNSNRGGGVLAACCRCTAKSLLWLVIRVVSFVLRWALYLFLAVWVLVKCDTVQRVRSSLDTDPLGDTGYNDLDNDDAGAFSSSSSVGMSGRPSFEYTVDGVTFAQAVDATTFAVQLWLALLSPAIKVYVLNLLDFYEPLAVAADQRIMSAYVWVKENSPAETIAVVLVVVALVVWIVARLCRIPRVARQLEGFRRRVASGIHRVVSAVGSTTLHGAFWACAAYFLLTVTGTADPAPSAASAVAQQGVDQVLRVASNVVVPVALSLVALKTGYGVRHMAGFWVVSFSWLALSRVAVVASAVRIVIPRVVCPLLSLAGRSDFCATPEATAASMSHLGALLNVWFVVWLVLPFVSGADLLMRPIAVFVNKYLYKVRGLTSNAEKQASVWSAPLTLLSRSMLGKRLGWIIQIGWESIVLLAIAFIFLLVSTDIGYWFFLCVFPTIKTLNALLLVKDNNNNNDRARRQQQPATAAETEAAAVANTPSDADRWAPLRARVMLSCALLIVDTALGVLNSAGVLWIPFMGTLQFLTVVAVQLPVLDPLRHTQTLVQHLLSLWHNRDLDPVVARGSDDNSGGGSDPAPEARPDNDDGGSGTGGPPDTNRSADPYRNHNHDADPGPDASSDPADHREGSDSGGNDDPVSEGGGGCVAGEGGANELHGRESDDGNDTVVVAQDQ